MRWLYNSSEDKPFNWSRLLIVGLTVVLVVTVVLGSNERKENRANQRALEVAGVEDVDGLVTARDEALEASADLEETIAELEARVPGVKIVETIRTVSNPLNTTLRDLLISKEAEMARVERDAADRVAAAVERVKQERPECTGLIHPSDCPEVIPDIQFAFHVVSEEVRLESDAGNTFAVGGNRIWEGECDFTEGAFLSDRCQEVGYEAWRSDISTLTKAPIEARRRFTGWYVGAQASIWRDSQSFDDYSLSPDSFRVYGGGDFAFKRLAVGLGGFVDPSSAGLDLRFSWHGER